MGEEKKQLDDKRQTTDDSIKKQNKPRDNKFRKKWIEKEKYNELEHKYKCALADYQNLLKQTAKEKQEFAKYANEQLLHEIIPVYDNLKISFKHAGEGTDNSGFAEGIKYIIKQFKDALESMGVEEIKADGKKFDHNIMEAVEGRGEKIKKVVKAGYKLNGKVIMAAKVILK